MALAICRLSSLSFTCSFPPLTNRLIDQTEKPPGQNQRSGGGHHRLISRRRLHRSLFQSAFQLLETRRGEEKQCVLLLVAPADHKMCIEVCYGLSGILTDALALAIIQRSFNIDEFCGGIERGVEKEPSAARSRVPRLETEQPCACAGDPRAGDVLRDRLRDGLAEQYCCESTTAASAPPSGCAATMS